MRNADARSFRNKRRRIKYAYVHNTLVKVLGSKPPGGYQCLPGDTWVCAMDPCGWARSQLFVMGRQQLKWLDETGVAHD